MPFASLPQINEELDRLERTGVLSKIEYIQRASPILYVKKKSKKIQVCVVFSYAYICWIHTGAINKDAETKTHAGRKTQEGFFNNNIYLSLYCKGSKGLFKGCM